MNYWKQTSLSDTTSWDALAASADGSIIAALSYSPYALWMSLDGGSTWTQRTGIGSGFWSGVCMSADGTKVAVTDYGDGSGSLSYIHTSTDTGVTWTTQAGSGGLSWKNICSSANGLVLAAQGSFIPSGTNASPGTLSVSTNGGVSWTDSGIADQQWTGINCSADGTKLYASSDGSGHFGQGPAIFVSTNSGSTWTPSLFALPIDDVDCDAAGNIVYACMLSGPATTPITPGSGSFTEQSPYNGNTYTIDSSGNALQNGSPMTGGSNTAQMAYYNNIVYAQNTSGNWFSWNQTSFNAILAPPITAVPTEIWRSTDSGSTWATALTGDTDGFYQIAVSSDGATIVALARYINTSTDSGVTWTPQVGLGINPTWSNIVVANAGTLLIALAQQGVWVGTLPITTTWTDDTASSGILTWQTIECSADGSRQVASAADDNSIWISSNSSASWTKQTGAGIAQLPYSLAISSDGTKVFATATNIWRSVNGGASFTEVIPGSGGQNWYAITSSADGLKVAACDNNADVWTSTDGGLTWTDQTGSSGIGGANDMVGSDDGMRLTAVYHNVWTSTDGGVVWTEAPGSTSPHGAWQAVCASDDQTVIAACDYNGNNLLISTNSGATWTASYPAGRDNGNQWADIVCSFDGSIIAVADVFGFVWTTNDAGVTWNIVGPNNNWQALAMSDNGSVISAVGFNTTPGPAYPFDSYPGDIWATPSATVAPFFSQFFFS